MSSVLQTSSAPQVAKSAPTVELGITNPYPLPSWAQFGSTKGGPFVDYLEYVPELRWPTSIRTTYPRMANDTQLKALIRATVMPILRYDWKIDPNGASDEMLEGIVSDLNLQILGSSTSHVRRTQNRFGFQRHMTDAFRALEYGHYFFEQVGTITTKSKGGDGLWHLKKLAPRPPRTVGQIFVETDGGLAEIRQYVGFWAPAIPVGNLVAYVWDQEPGNWVGQSMFRACYREWLIKDRLLRVDAINHEKSGGQWWANAPQGALQTEIDALGEVVSRIRVGEVSGAAVPFGADLHLEAGGRSNNSPILSINRHDEAMARAFLMMFMQLGSTETGSRALGDSFTDFAEIFRESIALWFAETFNSHVIEDWVDWNYGTGADTDLVPRLVFDKGQAAEQGAEADQFAPATLDPVTKAAIAGAPAWKVGKIRAEYEHAQAADRARLGAMTPAVVAAAAAISDISARRLGQITETLAAGRSGRDEVAALMAEAKSLEGDILTPETLELLSDHAGASLLDEMAHERILEAVAKTSHRAPKLAAVTLPARQLRREPFEHEALAKVDFAQIDQNWQSQADALVAEWNTTIKPTQVAALQQLIQDANGDLVSLSTITADLAGADLIASKLKTMAHLGAGEAAGEAARQGAAAVTPHLGDLEAQLEERANAVAQLLVSSLSQAAANKAVQLSGGGLTPPEVAAQTALHLDSLSDSYLRDQFGGALSAAQNAGRLAVMDASGADRYYASELLDTNTCEPCEDEDGTQFATAADAAAAYPTGGYAGCLGGPRCRGTVIAVYAEASGE